MFSKLTHTRAPCTRIAQSKLAGCLNELAGSPVVPDAALWDLPRDEGMLALWRAAPEAVFGALKFAAYRFEVVAWLGRELLLPVESGGSGAEALAMAAGTGRDAGRERSGEGGSSGWLTVAADPAVVKAVCDIDLGGCGLPVAPWQLAARAFLLDFALRGAVLGPLRRALATTRQVGPDLGAGWKWCGAVTVRDGRVFFLPRNASHGSILVLNPATGTTQLLDHPPSAHVRGGRNLYNGAVLGQDGCVYGIPASGVQVLKIDPAKTGPGGGALAGLVGPAFFGSWKWGQAVLAEDGNIYASPCNSKSILCIETGPLSSRSSESGVSLIPLRADAIEGSAAHADGAARSGGPASDTSSRWWGAAYVPATDEARAASAASAASIAIAGSLGFVYFTPQNAARVIKFDVATRGATPVGGALNDGGEKFHGACVAGGFVVACPANKGGRRVLVLDTKDDAMALIGPDQSGAHYKWHDTVRGADGCAYGIPHHASRVLKVDPSKIAGAMAAVAALKAAEADAATAARSAEQGGEGAAGTVAAAAAALAAAQALADAEGAEAVKALGEGFGRDGGLYGCGALAADGFVYAAPMHARRILRLNTLAAPETRRYFRVGGETQYYGEDSAPGTMLWLWREMPELWFKALAHPTYGPEFVAWFERESALAGSEFDDDDDDDDGGGGGAGKGSGSSGGLGAAGAGGGSGGGTAQTKSLAKQCGSALLLLSLEAAASGEDGGGGSGSRSLVYKGMAGSAYEVAVLRVAAIPGLVGSMLDVPDPGTRRALLSVPFVRRVLLCNRSVGPWALKRLADPLLAPSVLEYFDVAAALDAKKRAHRAAYALDSADGFGGGNGGGGNGGIVASALALPWANVNPPPHGTKFVAPEDKHLGGGDGAGSESGWGWSWWERLDLSLSWDEWARFAGSRGGGRLMTLAEAREVLKHQTLCPGEDYWVAVAGEAPPPAAGEKQTTFQAAAAVLKSADWVQVTIY